MNSALSSVEVPVRQRLLVSCVLFGILASTGAACGRDGDGATGPTSSVADDDETLRDRLERETGVKWRVDVAADGTIYAEPFTPPRSLTAASFIDRFHVRLGMTSGVVADRTLDLPDGRRVYGWYQTHDGVLVEDGHVSVQTDAGGAIELVVGRWVHGLRSVATTPVISDAEARQRAFDDAKARASWLEPSHVIGAIESGRVIFTRHGGAALAYRVSFEASIAPDDLSQPYLALAYVIDAQSGEVLAQRSRHADATGVDASGKGVRAYAFGEPDVKPFRATLPDSGVPYAMVSPIERGLPEIRIHDGSKPGTPLITSPFTSSWDERPVSDPLVAGNGAAVDAIANFTLVALYFQTKHGWASWDGKGSPIEVYVHAPLDPTGGHWASFFDVGESPKPGFVFWDRASFARADKTIAIDDNFLPASGALDVVAHEFGHAFTQYASRRGAPDGTGELRAVGEALADVMAAVIEHHYAPDDVENWTFAERVMRDGKPKRNAYDPTSAGLPAHVSRRAGPENHHSNSVIVSHAFRLMALGGTNAVSNVHIPPANGIGWDNLEKLAFAAARDVEPTTGFGELAWRTIHLSLRKLSIPVAPVTCAWVAVGVLSHEQAKREHGVDCSCWTPPPDSRAVAPNDPALACCQSESVACCRKCDDSILGHWQGDWGKISFAEVKGEVRAVYTFREGTVIARGREGTVEACWSETPTRTTLADHGPAPAEFRVLGRESRIDGRWQHLDNPRWHDNWDVAWVSPVIPADHRRRLGVDSDFDECRR